MRCVLGGQEVARVVGEVGVGMGEAEGPHQQYNPCQMYCQQYRQYPAHPWLPPLER